MNGNLTAKIRPKDRKRTSGAGSLHAERGFEITAFKKGYVTKYFRSRAIGGDFTPMKNDRPGAYIQNKIKIMGRYQARVGEFSKEIYQQASAPGIQTGAGLVHDKDVGQHRKHRCDGYGSLLAAGEPVRRTIGEVSRTYATKRLFRPERSLGGRKPLIERTKSHIIQDSGHE